MTPRAVPAMPAPARQAIYLMLLGALLQGATAALSALDRDGIRERTAQLARELQGRTLTGEALDAATSQAYWFTIVSGVVFALIWLVVARVCSRGKQWGRGLATLLATIYTFTFAFSGLTSFGPGTALGIALCGIGLSVVYLLWRRPVSAWMTCATPSASLPKASSDQP